MSTDASPPDFDDIPTRDLVPPPMVDVPLWTLANTNAIRVMRREQHETRAAVRTWGARIVGAILTGAITMAGAVVGVAMERGAESERARNLATQTARHDVRITKLEERQWQR